MLSSQFPVQIITDFSELSVKILVVEVRHSQIVDQLSKFGILVSEKMLEKINSREKNQKTFSFYSENSNIFEIICFLPDEEKIFDDRSELFQKYKNNIAYFPDGNEQDALEIFALATYEFTQYKTKKVENKKFFLVEENVELLSKLQSQIPLLNSILIARNLVNMPAGDLNPESLARAISERKWKNFSVEIFGDTQLRELGCNLIRAVGQGSVRENFMVILKPKKEVSGEKYGFIGKGVTFDAGGIQIKPDKYMTDMKCDMAGAASLLGVALYLDSLEKLPIHTIFGLALVENMTGSAAFKPLDVYKAYNGTTVEIHHTDAEGRLVLADAMAYVEKNFSVNHLTTIATLTGACLYALGNNITGIMGDDEKMITEMINNSSKYEPVWRLPLTENNKKALESEVADIKNLADGEYMGSSIGGAFLSYFQGNAKLAHLDIAGPAYRVKPFGYMPSGATGWGVKKLSEVILNLSLQ